MKNILKVLTGGLLKNLSAAVDPFITSKEEKAQLETKFNEVINVFHQQAQDQITDRLRIDMNSDSWLSKNIRPLTLIFILVTYTVLSVTDGNLVIPGREFSVNDAYITLLGQWGQAIMYFYFGGRTIEKTVSLFKEKKNKT